MTFGAASGGQAGQGEAFRPSSTAVRGARKVGWLVVVFLVTISAVEAAPAARAETAKGRRPDLKPLWSTFPLHQKQPHQRGNVAQQPVTTNGAQSGGSGESTLRLLLAVGAPLLLLAALTVAGVSLVRRRRSRPRRARVLQLARPRFRLPEGGLNVAFLRRRPQRDEADVSAEQSQAQAGEPRSPRDRLLQYSMTDNSPAVEGPAEAPAKPAVETEAEPVEPNVSVDVASVGEEVGTVLQSAHEAATRIRHAAQEEAERVQREAEATAADAVAEATRIAEADRSEGARVRADADEYARDTRATADAFAEQQRSDAEREAAQIVDNAQRRLADADAEIERKMREATERERQQIQTLQDEVAHYEERLDSILVVFRGVTSQLEDLLGRRKTKGGDPLEVAGEDLEEALQPDRPARVG